MKQLILIGFIVFTATVFAVEVNDAEWEAYKKEYKKEYSGAEDVKRRELYAKNKAEIEEHNLKFKVGEQSFEKEINQFSDLTKEERKQFRGGLMRSKRDIGLEFEWEEYKKKFDKHYEPEENNKRKELYLRRKLDIYDHNEKFDKGEVSFKKDIDQLTDLTDEEIESKAKEVKETSHTHSEHATQHKRPRRSPERFEVPEDTPIDEEWEAYKQHFNKKYEGEEDAKRKENYIKNKIYIEEHNAKVEAAGGTLRLGINQFSDKERPDASKPAPNPNQRKRRSSDKFEVPKGTPIDEEWELYKKHFKKSYEPEEDAKRKDHYIKTKTNIDEHNANLGEHDYALDINIYTDLSEAESLALRDMKKRTKRSPGKFEVAEGTSIDDEWIAYKKHFEKTYEGEEDDKRKAIYIKNKAHIETENAKAEASGSSLRLGINSFADKEHHEVPKGLKLPAGCNNKDNIHFGIC